MPSLPTIEELVGKNSRKHGQMWFEYGHYFVRGKYRKGYWEQAPRLYQKKALALKRLYKFLDS